MSYKVLVVDDTAFMRKMAADCLKQHGHTVVGEAVNGKEGIEKYIELSPDIVMMDLMMPEMNGIDAIKEILELNPEAVILVCSASNQQEQIFDALDAGAKGYLTKPFVSDRMKEVIQKYADPFFTKAKTDEVDEAASEYSEEAPQLIKEEQTAKEEEIVPVIEHPMVEQNEKSNEEVKSLKPNKGNLSNFITSYMCHWHEEINNETNNFSVVCSEKEDKILIEMTSQDHEKQVIQFTFDGFRQLNEWLVSHQDHSIAKAN